MGSANQTPKELLLVLMALGALLRKQLLLEASVFSLRFLFFFFFFFYILSRKFYTEYFTVFTIYSYLKLNKEPKGGCMVVPISAMFSNYSQYGIYF